MKHISILLILTLVLSSCNGNMLNRKTAPPLITAAKAKEETERKEEKKDTSKEDGKVEKKEVKAEEEFNDPDDYWYQWQSQWPQQNQNTGKMTEEEKEWIKNIQKEQEERIKRQIELEENKKKRTAGKEEYGKRVQDITKKIAEKNARKIKEKEEKKSEKTKKAADTKKPITNCYSTEYCTKYGDKIKCHKDPNEWCGTDYPQNNCVQAELWTIKDKYYVSYFYNNKPGENFYTMSQFNQYGQCISEGMWKESGHYFLEACDTKDPDYPIGKLCYNRNRRINRIRRLAQILNNFFKQPNKAN